MVAKKCLAWRELHSDESREGGVTLIGRRTLSGRVNLLTGAAIGRKQIPSSAIGRTYNRSSVCLTVAPRVQPPTACTHRRVRMFAAFLLYMRLTLSRAAANQRRV